MTLHLAFSAGHFVNQASKIGGFAALVGLAVLALLYFSQARELKRLREWAAEAPDRAAELEQRLMSQAASVRRTSAPRPAAGQPATPAGVAAPPPPPTAVVKAPHGRRWAILMGPGIVVIVALVAPLITGALGGGGGKGKSATSANPASAGTATPATKAKPKATPKPFARGHTTV